MSTIAFSVFPPTRALQRDIECFRIAEYSGDEAVNVKTCPNGLPGLVFHVASGKSAIDSIATCSAKADDLPLLFLHDAGLEPSVIRFVAGPYFTLQVTLKPHALYSIFGIDCSALHNSYWRPHEFGGAQLEKDLLGMDSNGERITLLGQFLIDKIAQTNQRDELIEISLEMIHADFITTSVPELSQRLHISQRQFEKRFLRVVGIPPKQYLRIKRVNAALELIRSGRFERLSDIAQELHFFDQSHFVRDIKQFSWVTPTSIAQKVSEFRQDQTGASYL